MDEQSSDRKRRSPSGWQIAIGIGVAAGVILPVSWRIAYKAGYRPALSMSMLVSPLNVLLLIAFAFREWPIERELRRLKLAVSAGASEDYADA